MGKNTARGKRLVISVSLKRNDRSSSKKDSRKDDAVIKTGKAIK
jgi:hypothetical protein